MTLQEWKNKYSFTDKKLSCGACEYCYHDGDLNITYCEKMYQDTDDASLIKCQVDEHKDSCDSCKAVFENEN